MSSKLAKLEATLALLEKAVGLDPDMEVITQRDDGTWPEPVTDAPVIVERVRFLPEHAVIAAQRRNEAALADEVRARDAVNASPLAQRVRRKAK